MTLPIDFKIKVVQFWYETKSIVMVKRRLANEFGLMPRQIPGRSTLIKIIKKFVETGKLDRAPVNPLGRKRTARTDENVNRVLGSVERAPRLSCRRRSQELGMTYTSVNRILKKDLHLTPYLVPVKQALSAQDIVERERMCEWFLRGIQEDQEWTSRIWFSDEAHFALNSAVNRRSNVYWGQNKPTEVSQRPLHSPKVTVWCAMSSNMVIGPFFFEDGQGNTVTVNQENYRSVLAKFVASLRRRQVNLNNAWFQQDGATPHATIETLRRLQQVFGDRVISRRTNNPWSPHSPDLNPLDFFHWGFIFS